MVQHGAAGKEVQWVECGRIGRAIGLKGECAVFWNDETCSFQVGSMFFVDRGDGKGLQQCKIAALRRQGRFDVLRLEGIEDRMSAEALRGATLVRSEESLEKLPDGQYYCYQILGMTVLTDAGDELGTIVRIFTAGENDVYEVLPHGAKKGAEILVPAIRDVILSVDVVAKRMIIKPMKGMLDQ
jgi:16S rRNA processing protein RimM